MNNVFLPHSMDELWQLLEREPRAQLYAGGTDLLVKLRSLGLSGSLFSGSLICLERIAELQRMYQDGEAVFIGSCSTHRQILENDLVCECFPLLVKAVKTLGSPPIRNMGTIGGNICTASPAGDALPALYILDAEVEMRSKDGSRRTALKDFIMGPGKTALHPDEVLYGVWINRNIDCDVHHFEKVGQRKALAIAIASLAALLKISGTGEIQKARLAWGSVGPTIVTSPEVEGALVGKALTEETLKSAVPLAKAAVAPIDDVRASAKYRRAVAGNLLLRLMEYGDHGRR